MAVTAAQYYFCFLFVEVTVTEGQVYLQRQFRRHISIHGSDFYCSTVSVNLWGKYSNMVTYDIQHTSLTLDKELNGLTDGCLSILSPHQELQTLKIVHYHQLNLMSVSIY